MNGRGQWRDWKCGARHDFVCEMPATPDMQGDETNATEAPPTEAPGSEDVEEEENADDNCEKGWHAFDDSCYLLGDKKRNMHRAKAFCKKQGATLPIIEDDAENEAVSELLGKR